MPNSDPLKIALKMLMLKRAEDNDATKDADSHEVCTAHGIAALLTTCFSLKTFFTRKKYHNSTEEFKRQKQE
jgi:hypothetical protein